MIVGLLVATNDRQRLYTEKNPPGTERNEEIWTSDEIDGYRISMIRRDLHPSYTHVGTICDHC